MLQLIHIEKTHTGKYLHVYDLTYQDKIGGTHVYEIASRNPNLTKKSLGESISGVSILAMDKTHDKILLTHEFKMGLNRYIHDIPSGLCEPGETTEQAAARELQEETGLQITKTLCMLNPSYTAGPITDDMTRLLICEADGEPRPCHTPRENITSDWYTHGQIKELLKTEDILFSMRAQMLCHAWIEEQLQVSTPAGIICATGDNTSNYPGVSIDLLRPDGVKTRLAMTEYVPEAIEPAPDYEVQRQGEDIHGTLKVPTERVQDGAITPGLVSRAYPNMNPMDDEEHVTFHF